MTKRFDKKQNTIIAVVALVIVFIILSVVRCVILMRNEIENQVQVSLEDVTNQNIMALRNQINDNYTVLKSVENQLLREEGGIEANISALGGFVEEYGLKRIAYCASNGITYSTDNVTLNLSYREFFKRGMQGKVTITEVLKDAMSAKHEQINILSKPVWVDDEIVGVIGLTYYSQKLNETLQMLSFEGNGKSYAISETGQIMISSDNENLEVSKNFFDDILSAEENDVIIAEQLKEMISAGESGGGKLWLGNEEYCYYATPVSLIDGQINWYMLTLIPASYMGARTAPIEAYMFRMLAFLFFALVVGALLIFLLSREQRKAVYALAYTDSLTNGDNFPHFEKKLSEMRKQEGYFVALDLDDFRTVNIAVGAEMGDVVLRHVWGILARAIDDDECAARVSGDSFVLFLRAKSKKELLNRIEAVAIKTYDLAEELKTPTLKPRFGIYPASSDDNAEECYIRATQAKELVKKRSDRFYAFYSEVDHERIVEDKKLEDSFDSAIDNKSFEVWYQPKYSAESGKQVGAEALVRWRADGGLISPGRFIPLFERNGEITRLDEYMFRNVCLHQKHWLDEGRKVLPVSVNLSRATLYNDNIVEKYLDIMKECEVDPKYVQLEVTESIMTDKKDVDVLLSSLRAAGVKVLMDDFGTGYSSLSTLRMDCFDTLKIDKSLVDNIGSKRGETMLYHVICMAKQLGMKITAEGVETEVQLNYLRNMGCDNIQGFYFARPMCMDDYEKILESE